MGLGINGGGLGTARFLHSRGARVTVTDLRTADELRPDVDALPASVRLALGGHRVSDFAGADLVVKNPGVPSDSPFLAAAAAAGADVQTDQSLFLARCPAPVLAVTGSKGKSTTAAALAAILREDAPGTRLGGNIGGSPLDFLDELTADTPVVLELSSWQLGDLRGRGLLAPSVAVVTNLLRDHQNRYRSMEEYLQDKRVIAEGQPPGAALVLNADDPWHRRFADGAAARIVLFSVRHRPAGDGAWIEDGAGRISVRGRAGVAFGAAQGPAGGGHGRVIGANLLAAAAAAAAFGSEPASIRRALSHFRGLPHRLEPVGEVAGVRFVNDSAATIPEATVAALGTLWPPVVLMAGGADKELSFSALAATAASLGPDALRRCVLLAGSATAKLETALRRAGVGCDGPFDSLEDAFAAALRAAVRGATVLLSPGCASFGMFRNEFDRGDRFRALVRQHAAAR